MKWPKVISCGDLTVGQFSFFERPFSRYRCKALELFVDQVDPIEHMPCQID